MKQKLALQKLEELLKRSAFSSREAKALGVNAATLAYYVKSGDLVRLGHGIYRGIQAPPVEDFRFEDLVAALAAVKGGVICLVSALALYDLTDEIPRQHWIAVPNSSRHRGPATVKIIRLRNLTLGKTLIDLNDQSLPIFDRERTLIDSFRYLGIETGIKSLRLALSKKGIEKIDLGKMREYAKLLRVDIEPLLLALTT